MTAATQDVAPRGKAIDGIHQVGNGQIDDERVTNVTSLREKGIADKDGAGSGQRQEMTDEGQDRASQVHASDFGHHCRGGMEMHGVSSGTNRQARWERRQAAGLGEDTWLLIC